MMRNHALACTAAFLLFAGCSSNDVTIRPNPEQKACLNDYALAPDWVCGTTNSAATAEGSGDSIQEAKTDALAHLKKKIKSDIITKVSGFYQSQGVKDTYFITHSSEEVADSIANQLTLESCKVIDIWQNPNNLAFFSLLHYPKELLNKTIKQNITYSVTRNPSILSQFDTQNSFDTLEDAFPASGEDSL